MSNAHADWSRAFDDPITLPDGRVLKTLHDAGHYVTALPKTEQATRPCFREGGRVVVFSDSKTAYIVPAEWSVDDCKGTRSSSNTI